MAALAKPDKQVLKHQPLTATLKEAHRLRGGASHIPRARRGPPASTSPAPPRLSRLRSLDYGHSPVRSAHLHLCACADIFCRLEEAVTGVRPQPMPG